MATTKTEAVEVKAKVDKVVDPWSIKKAIRVPRATNGEANYLIASVNGRVFKIQRGIEVEVPAPIAEVIAHSFEAEDEAVTFIDKISK